MMNKSNLSYFGSLALPMFLWIVLSCIHIVDAKEDVAIRHIEEHHKEQLKDLHDDLVTHQKYLKLLKCGRAEGGIL